MSENNLLVLGGGPGGYAAGFLAADMAWQRKGVRNLLLTTRGLCSKPGYPHPRG